MNRGHFGVPISGIYSNQTGMYGGGFLDSYGSNYSSLGASQIGMSDYRMSGLGMYDRSNSNMGWSGPRRDDRWSDRRYTDDRRGSRRSPGRSPRHGGRRDNRPPPPRRPRSKSRERGGRRPKRSPKPCFTCPTCSFSCCFQELFEFHSDQFRHKKSIDDMKEAFRLKPEIIEQCDLKYNEYVSDVNSKQDAWVKAKEERKAKKEARKSKKDKWWCELCELLVERKINVDKHGKDNADHKSHLEKYLELDDPEDDEQRKAGEEKKKTLELALKSSYKETLDWSDVSDEEDSHEERDRKQLEREVEKVEKRLKEEIERAEKKAKKEEEDKVKREEEKAKKEEERLKREEEKAKNQEDDEKKDDAGEKEAGDPSEGDDAKDEPTMEVDDFAVEEQSKDPEVHDKDSTKIEGKKPKEESIDTKLRRLIEDDFKVQKEKVKDYGRTNEFGYWKGVNVSEMVTPDDLIEVCSAYHCIICDFWFKTEEQRDLHLQSSTHHVKFRNRMMDVTALSSDQRRVKDLVEKFLGISPEKRKRRSHSHGSSKRAKSTKDDDSEMVVLEEVGDEAVNGNEDVEDSDGAAVADDGDEKIEDADE